MKYIIKLVLVFLIFNFTFSIINAQVAINGSGDAPDASAMLDISSTEKGLLIPRMDSTARSMIQNPSEGLLVYDESSRSFWYFKEEWTELNQDVNIEFDGKAIVIKQPLSFKNTADVASNTSPDEDERRTVTGEVWQSFTPTVDGTLSQINVTLSDGDDPIFDGGYIRVYEGEGEAGNLLAEIAVGASDNLSVNFDAASVTLQKGSIYTFSMEDTVNNRWTQYYTSGYAGGRASFNANDDLFFSTFMNFDSTHVQEAITFDTTATPYSMNLNTVDTIFFSDGTYQTTSFPDPAGVGNQILITDTNGMLAWVEDDKAFTSTNGITSSVNNDDDFVFGADSLNYGSGTETKFFFDKEKGAFRVGAVADKSWDQDSLGTYSIALGVDTKATATSSLAIGSSSIATDNFAISVGSFNEASGNTSNAFGHNNTASGDISNAFGSVNTASGSFSSAFGAGSTASGNTSAALGYLATAEGSSSTALGFAAIASGFGSYALGAGANAKGYFSTTLGRETAAYSFGETAVGLFNTEYTPIDSTAFAAEDRLFVIGNGTDLDNSSDALRIYKNGNAELNGALTIDSAYTFPIVDGVANQFLTTDGNGTLSWAANTESQTLSFAEDFLSITNGEAVDLSDLRKINTDGLFLEGNSLQSTITSSQNLSPLQQRGSFFWQSFKANHNGIISQIDISIESEFSIGQLIVREGEGRGGAVLLTADSIELADGWNSIVIDTFNVQIEKDNQYTFEVNEYEGTFNANLDTGIYPDLDSSLGDDEALAFRVRVIEAFTEEIIQVSENGNSYDINLVNIDALSFSDGSSQSTAFPNPSGASNQMLVTDGSGNIIWDDTVIDTDTDNQTIDKLNLNGTILELSLEDDGEDEQTVDLATLQDDLGSHSATQNIQLNGQWISNDGDSEGLSITDNGNVSFSTDLITNQFWISGDGDNEGVLIDNDGTTYVSDDLYVLAGNIRLSDSWISNDGESEGIAIDDDGKVGIRNASPSALLDLGDGSGSDAVLLRFNSERSWQFEQIGSGANNNLFLRSSSSGKNFNIISTDGTTIASYRANDGNNNKVGINQSIGTNSNTLEVNGTASKSAAGDWLANSDARLKKNIQPLHSQQTLEKLLALQGVTYEWNDDKTGTIRPEGIQYGFTAQNVQAIFPNLVTEDGNGYLQTAYGTYDAMYVEAMRALSTENEELKMENEKLVSRVEKLEASIAKINQLEAMLTQLQAQISNNLNPVITKSTEEK